MDWSLALQVTGLIGGIATILAFFLAPAFYIGAKLDKIREEMQAEMKDFHAQLLEIKRGK
jgi:hypothetical protein